jgi:hypothetical protein
LTARRTYELSPRDQELRYVVRRLICDACCGAYDVRGVVGAGATGLRSYSASIHQHSAAHPCCCADVLSGARIS